MKFKITGANRDLGQIEIAYFTQDDQHVASMCLDVPVENGVFVSGEQLDQLILAQAPTWGVQRKDTVTAATGFDAIESRVEYMPGATPQEIEAARLHGEMVAQLDFERKVAAVLVKFGVVQNDPMAISTTAL